MPEPTLQSFTDQFPTDPTGLTACRAPEVVDLSNDETFTLEIAAVAKRLGDTTVRMLAYNGSIPGPTLRVAQGSEVEVNVVNQGDLEATVHWRVTFPRPGPVLVSPAHPRGLRPGDGPVWQRVLVVPADPEYWPPAHREIVLTLDDVLIEDDAVAPFSRSQTTHTAMGRFGNVLLVGGEPDLALSARPGEVVRF